MTWTEKVTITVPNAGPVLLEISVDLSEDDEAIASRLAPRFSPGTIIGLSASSKWVVVKGSKVARKGSEPPPPPASDVGSTTVPREDVEGGPRVGEVWRPKDPRRQASFRVASLTPTEALADDGRRVKLDRFNRYVRVTPPSSVG